MSYKRHFLLSIAFVLALVLLPGPRAAWGQTDPALQMSVEKLFESYLVEGPRKSELSNGPALAAWAILNRMAIPDMLAQAELRKGAWRAVWEPIRTVLEERDFAELSPLEAITYYEETEVEPVRFVRLLARDGLIDLRHPDQRQRAEALRAAIGAQVRRLEAVRSNVRFERAGWNFTGTAALTPGERIVRVALRGSKPCNISGRAATSNLTLKGRLFAAPGSKDGIKVQLLEHRFDSQGCQLSLKTQVSGLAPLQRGGEVRVSGSLNLQIRGEVVSGRLQVDIATRGTNNVDTGRGVYNLRGKVDENGELQANLVPVSASGARDLRGPLEETGVLRGTVKLRQGQGTISLPVLARPIEWKGTSLD